MAAMIPNCVSYDPTFAYELAVIMQDGLKRMIENQEDVFYYITVMNENYSHPEMPKGSEADIIKGMYSFSTSKIKGEKVQLMGSGVILREVIEAQKILESDYGVSADVWSVTSFNELRKDALEADRWNRMNPDKPQKESHVVKLLKKSEGPIIASTDYMKSFAEQIAVFLPHKFVALGTDGFGRSDSREKLRHFFEVDRHYVVVATLKALSDEGKIKSSVVTDAIKKFKLDPNKPNPVTQ
jgi:pyruvate dehydrogenase E1 component